MKNKFRAQSKFRGHVTSVVAAGLVSAGCLGFQGRALAEEAKPAEEKADTGIELAENREELKLPGITVQIKKRYVDVESTVALETGMLELLACTKDTKEHESILAVNAKASHIHAALLLLKAKPGNPAMRKKLEDGRWIDLPPRGSEIDVSLVIENEKGGPVERPIADFIEKADDDYYETTPKDPDPEEKVPFPTSTFVFAGSHIYKDGKNPPVYLSDESGNVITLAVFGDELLSLPAKHAFTHSNEGLVWAVDPTHLPPVGTEVILRLRPKSPEVAPDEKLQKP